MTDHYYLYSHTKIIPKRSYPPIIDLQWDLMDTVSIACYIADSVYI